MRNKLTPPERKIFVKNNDEAKKVGIYFRQKNKKQRRPSAEMPSRSTIGFNRSHDWHSSTDSNEYVVFEQLTDESNLSHSAPLREIVDNLSLSFKDLTTALSSFDLPESSIKLEDGHPHFSPPTKTANTNSATKLTNKDSNEVIDSSANTPKYNHELLLIGQNIETAFDKLQATSINLLTLFKFWRVGEFLKFDDQDADKLQSSLLDESDLALSYIQKNFSFAEIKRETHYRLVSSLKNLSNKMDQAVILLEEARKNEEADIERTRPFLVNSNYTVKKRRFNELNRINDLTKLLLGKSAVVRFLFKDELDKPSSSESEQEGINKTATAQPSQSELPDEAKQKRGKLLEKMLSTIANSRNISDRNCDDRLEDEKMAGLFNPQLKTVYLAKLKQEFSESTVLIERLMDKVSDYASLKDKLVIHRATESPEHDRNIVLKTAQFDNNDDLDKSSINQPKNFSFSGLKQSFQNKRPLFGKDKYQYEGSLRAIEQLKIIINGEAGPFDQ